VACDPVKHVRVGFSDIDNPSIKIENVDSRTF
jgi:hypothetical protein